MANDILPERQQIIEGRYQILATIGEGGMSHVHLVYDRDFGCTWAAKELKLSDDPYANARNITAIFDEAKMVQRFRHPAIPRIRGVAEDGLRFYVFMDYIDADTLDELVWREGHLPVDRIVDVGVQLCDVTDYLHRHRPPVIYRDMKPANVMVRGDGTIVLVDFGIARVMGGQHNGRPVVELDDDDLLGTIGYASPEQERAESRLDARSDVYSLGATLFNLATGVAVEDMDKSIPDSLDDVSKGLARVIAKACAPTPDGRYATCAEMACELARCRAYDGRGVYAGSRAALRRYAIVVGVTALVAAALVATLAALGIAGGALLPLLIVTAAALVAVVATVCARTCDVPRAMRDLSDSVTPEEVARLRQQRRGSWRRVLGVQANGYDEPDMTTSSSPSRSV